MKRIRNSSGTPTLKNRCRASVAAGAHPGSRSFTPHLLPSCRLRLARGDSPSPCFTVWSMRSCAPSVVGIPARSVDGGCQGAAATSTVDGIRLAILGSNQGPPKESRCMRKRTAASHGKPGTRNFPAIIAISVVAFAAANLLHEGAGHGGACWLAGGHAKALSTVHFECSRGSRFVSAGGTLVNLIAGLLCWIRIRFLRHKSGHVRYFVWLLMTVNLLQAGGYLLFSGLGNFGDWADVIAGLTPVWLWRTGLTVLGAVSYVLAVWLALLELRPFLAANDWRRGGAKDLTLVPYITGGILYTVAGFLNPVGMMLVGLSAAAASFGGTSGMAWMTQWLGSRFVRKSRSPCFTLQHSRGWLIAAFITASLFIGLLGRGIRFT
jgi:hypothetical protein